MANEAASIGANFSNYTGNEALGGGVDVGVLNIDTKPLQNLGYYTMLYNKTEYEQKQKDTDIKVKQLADLSNIRLNDLRGKDKDQATKEFADLVSYAGEYAKKNPKTQQEKMQQELDWQTKLGAFYNNYGSGKQRAIAYQTNLNAIKQKTGDASLQDLELRQLNKSFDETDIGTPISALPEFKMETIQVPAPVTQKTQAIRVGKDLDYSTEATIYNPALNASVADSVVLGVKTLYPQKGTPEYQKLSDNEKLQADYQATVSSGGKIWNDMAAPLNTVLAAKGADGKPLYFDENGAFNSQKFENDNATNSVVMRAYTALKNLDSYSRNNYEQAISPNGVFTDNGVPFKLKEPINPIDFKAGFIDFNKGVSASQLIQAGMYAQHQGNTFDTKITKTGLGLDYDQLKEKTVNDKENRDIEWAKLQQAKKEWQSKQDASETVSNNAYNFAVNRYKSLQLLADKEGIVHSDKLSNLTSEDLKYLGSEKPEVRDANGKIIQSAGLYPLDLNQVYKDGDELPKGKKIGDKVDVVLKVTDGKIFVLKDAVVNDNGTMVKGNYDNTSSTTVDQMATLRLKEELKSSGPKELNAFMGLDANSKGEISNTFGKKGSASGSSGSIKGTVRMMLPDGSVGEIPESSLPDFIKAYPKAKRVK